MSRNGAVLTLRHLSRSKQQITQDFYQRREDGTCFHDLACTKYLSAWMYWNDTLFESRKEQKLSRVLLSLFTWSNRKFCV